MKKIILLTLLVLALLAWFFKPKIFPYYSQLTQERVGINVTLQNQSPKKAKDKRRGQLQASMEHMC